MTEKTLYLILAVILYFLACIALGVAVPREHGLHAFWQQRFPRPQPPAAWEDYSGE